MNVLDINDARWGDFARSQPDALPFHHPAWSALLADCYGYEPFALALVESTGKVIAGLPLLELRKPFGGRQWISLPFTDYCPPLAADNTARCEMVDALADVQMTKGISQLLVRSSVDGPRATLRQCGVIHTLQLTADPEATYRTFKKSQVRASIAKAERQGVTVRRGESLTDLVDVFYGLHLQTRRRLGVPVQPRRFFRLVWERMIASGLGFVLLAYVDNVPVAGGVFFTWNGTIIYKFGASNPAFWSVYPNNLLLWDAIRWGCENGYRIFDFGRTDLDNQGLRTFKNGWGTKEEPLVYSSFGGVDASSGRGRLNEMLGTVIRRSPPWVCRVVGETLYKYAA